MPKLTTTASPKYEHTATNVARFQRQVVVNVPALLLLGKLLEPIWGSKEFLKFILVVSTGTSLLTWVLMICLYYITQKEHFLYDKISGFHGVVAGFLVALKQLMPDQELSAVSVIKFRARWLSPIVVLLSITLCVVFGDPHAVLPFVIFGTYTSWLYLRFFQTKPEGNLKGDPSEEFSFASFFPDLLRPLVGGVAWVFYRLFCSRAEASPTDANTGYILGGKPLPGSDPVDASRRR
ncbi:hypothetical protein CBR_g52157 [Chara braunii]|uniref:Transmembrane protein 115 n=1 Tax=Chara braunii TaxID=69332 RepID=A0A388M9Y0_CHABU|nr:hypothetical protein CBR_g52157 [Chara braunii]|eukprot:GBG91272.1 hypothetical protein CBR_g52157 [Chara braunii]